MRVRSQTFARGAAVVSALLLGLASNVANAATGDLVISPNPGTNINAASVDTPRPCSAGATHVQTRLEGNGFEDSSMAAAVQGPGFNISSNSLLAPYAQNASGGLSIPLLMTFQTAADAQVPPAPLKGVHTLTTRCKNGPANSKVYDSFSVQINFTSPTSYSVVGIVASPGSPVAGANGTSPAPAADPSVAASGADASVATSAPASTPAASDAGPAMSSSTSAQGTESAPDASISQSAAAPSSSAGASSRSTDGESGSPRVAPAVRGVKETTSGSQLPRTGRSVELYLVYGFGLLVAGVATAWYARRKGYTSFGGK